MCFVVIFNHLNLFISEIRESRHPFQILRPLMNTHLDFASSSTFRFHISSFWSSSYVWGGYFTSPMLQVYHHLMFSSCTLTLFITLFLTYVLEMTISPSSCMRPSYITIALHVLFYIVEGLLKAHVYVEETSSHAVWLFLAVVGLMWYMAHYSMEYFAMIFELDPMETLTSHFRWLIDWVDFFGLAHVVWLSWHVWGCYLRIIITWHEFIEGLLH